MQAIRIEAADGFGLFNTYGCDEYGNDYLKPREFKCVYRFAPKVGSRHNKFLRIDEEVFADDFISGKHFCAYKSVAQLQEWIFPEEMKLIMSYGYEVYLLELSEALEGKDQIAYKKEHILKKTNISSLF